VSALAARIFNVQRFSTEDGPGLRTTVFMKGCPLRCRWCHNPEGLTAPDQLAWTAARCARCYRCVAACPRKAVAPGTAGGAADRPADPIIDRARCLIGHDDPSCRHACATACPRKAIEVVGRRVDVDSLVGELLRDEPFYRASGGGVTFSGGEAGWQADFVIAAAERLRAAGVHVALDTSGHLPAADFDRLAVAVDLVLFDLKHRDPARHQELTGVGLELIDANFRRLAGGDLAGDTPVVWVRVPVIPGCTDDEDNVRAVARFIIEVLPRAATPGLGPRSIRVDLLAYNNLAEGDYARVGLPYKLGGLPLCRREDLDRLKAAMAAEGLAEVHVSGRFRSDDGRNDGHARATQ
jgi:pyruvate formate lyase activating enzyme